MLLKRVISVTIIVVCLFLTGVYFYIPSILTVKNINKINCNSTGSCRVIDNWKKAFYRQTDTSFILDNYSYHVVKKNYNGAEIAIKFNNKIYATKLSIIALTTDTSLFEWTTSIKTNNNPLSKLETYLQLIDLKKNMYTVVKQLRLYLENDSNIYRYKIRKTTLTDTFLVSIKKTYKEYPNTREIYQTIVQLQQYANKQAAKQTNSPMLNIMKINGQYTTMVGLPVNKPLPVNKDVLPKRLSPIKDKILTTEVKGGEATIQDAYKQIEIYMQDHALTAPVIPFELIITDRSKEADTLKWITRIYYPIT